MPTCPIPINNETFRLVDEVKLWRGSMDEATDSSALAQVKLSGMQEPLGLSTVMEGIGKDLAHS